MPRLSILPTIDFLQYPYYKALYQQYLQHTLAFSQDFIYQEDAFATRWKQSLAIFDEEVCQIQQVDWLIDVFQVLFVDKNVLLVRGDGEPEYFPAQNGNPARIEFAHGFFASALHEISHWCIAGKHRRTLPDFGYWYAPDGRTQQQQIDFEKVEIKPQAIEYLLTQACQKPFRVSQDNLFAQFDTSQSTFSKDVIQQAQRYLTNQDNLPHDAQRLLKALLVLCQWHSD